MPGWPSLFGLAIGSILLVGHQLLKRENYRFPWLVNLTASLPKGLYESIPCNLKDPATLIQFFPPGADFDLYIERGYLKENMSLVKPIGAYGGDEVCWENETLRVNGRRVVDIPASDAVGRLLPHPVGCEILRHDRVLPLQIDHPRSLDGRFFGSIAMASVEACVRPLWVAQSH